MSELYEEALRAANELFNDTSVSQSEALINLKILSGEIDVMIECIQNDVGADHD